MPTAEIITIGTELLLGEIVDTNAYYLARSLRDNGIDLYRKTTVGDNIQRIAQTVQESLERCDMIITTGGLGPTVDDPTRDAIALAVGVPVEYCPDLWEQILSRFKRYGRQPTENNRKQAYIPQGALAVENKVGTAPAFIVEKNQSIIISLPGVPREMEYLMEHDIIPYLRTRFSLHSVIKTRTIHTAGIGESVIDDIISELETMHNPTVGLSAHSGQVDVRITSKADSETKAEKMILQVEAVIRERLAEWIYGIDEETLEGTALAALKDHRWSLALVETGLRGELIKRLTGDSDTFHGGQIFSDPLSQDDLYKVTAACRESCGADVALGVSLIPGAEKHEVYITLITPEEEQKIIRPYGGASGNAPRWAVNHCLNLLRNL